MSAPRQQAWALPNRQSLWQACQCEPPGQALLWWACVWGRLPQPPAMCTSMWARLLRTSATGQHLLCRHEYGEAALTLELVDSMDEAIDHIHAHGSGHTEAIITGECHKR